MLSELFADAAGRPASDGGIPGIVAAAGRGSSVLETWTAGRADTVTGAPMTPETIFDLASLTKVVSTTTLVLSLAGSGALDLDRPASYYLPRVPWDAVTIRHLLSHTSGLPPTVKFYETCSSRSAVLDGLFAIPLDAAPGTRVAYSDLGFMTLGEVVARVSGLDLDAAFLSLIAQPLSLATAGYLPSGPLSRFAATEFRPDGTPWKGIVHDENARAMGGVAGHAGLFAPVADLARFAAWWVSSSDAVVPARLRRLAESCQTRARSASGCLPGDGGRPGRRGLGWVLRGDRYDSLAGAWPGSAVSHNGFTGTSLALDPESGAWFVLLTNRVHYGRAESAGSIKSLRHAAHTAAANLLFP